MSECSCGQATYEVSAGNHARQATVVSVPCECQGQAECECGCCDPEVCECGHQSDCPCDGQHAVWELDHRGRRVRQVPSQCVCGPDGCRLLWLVTDLPAGATRRYGVTQAEESAQIPSISGGVQVHLEDGKQADFFLGPAPLTSYVFRHGIARPYCYPVYGPGTLQVTNFAPHDHPHHKSMYVAHGEVNGHDNWSELEGHASTVNTRVEVIAQGPITGVIRSVSDWVSARGDKLLREITTIAAYDLGPEVRVMDWRIVWYAAYGGVYLGDTKEAGTISIRVAESMEENRGGRIVNAYGAVTEAECWGRRAPWVDYYGPVGKEILGIAVFDHPSNFRHPTWWHVRSYGLFTANQWGIHEFTGDWSQRGDHTLRPGEKLVFNFRVYIHRGDTQAGDVAGHYLDYAFPPKVERVED